LSMNLVFRYKSSYELVSVFRFIHKMLLLVLGTESVDWTKSSVEW